MMYQYSFFQVEEKPWEDIDEVWLLEYMQEHFPDLFFEIDNGKVKSKDGQSELSVNISILKNYESDTHMKKIWTNPKLISLEYTIKKPNHYGGCGWAVDSLEKFEAGVEQLVSGYMRSIA